MWVMILASFALNGPIHATRVGRIFFAFRLSYNRGRQRAVNRSATTHLMSITGESVVAAAAAAPSETAAKATEEENVASKAEMPIASAWKSITKVDPIVLDVTPKTGTELHFGCSCNAMQAMRMLPREWAVGRAVVCGSLWTRFFQRLPPRYSRAAPPPRTAPLHARLRALVPARGLAPVPPAPQRVAPLRASSRLVRAAVPIPAP